MEKNSSDHRIGAENDPVQKQGSLHSDDMYKANNSLKSDESRIKPRRASARSSSELSARVAGAHFQNSNMVSERDRLKDMLRDMRHSKTKKAVIKPYYDTGWAQYIAKHPYFENGTLCLIVVNSIWLAVDADYNNAPTLNEAEVPFIVMENFFCTIFTGELFIRFLAYRKKQFALVDAWFMFDLFLVLFMIMETWVMTILVAALDLGSGLGGNTSVLRLLRLLRLLRMARMVRVLRSMPELLILIRGMAAATRSVCYSLCLLIILMYIFSIIFVNSLKETQIGDEYFPNVPLGMNSLLCFGTFYDGIDSMLDRLLKQGLQYYVIFMTFSLLAALMVMNLLIGVLCEVVSGVSATEKDAILVDNVRDILLSGRRDENPQISKEEFLRKMESPILIHGLNNINVDVLGLLDLADDLFIDGDVAIDDFMDYIGQFRGSHASVLKEVTDIKRMVLANAEEKAGAGGGMMSQMASRRASYNSLPPGSGTTRAESKTLLKPSPIVRNNNNEILLSRASGPPPVWDAPVQPSVEGSTSAEALTKTVMDLQKQVTKAMGHIASDLVNLSSRIDRIESTIVIEPASESSVC